MKCNYCNKEHHKDQVCQEYINSQIPYDDIKLEGINSVTIAKTGETPIRFKPEPQITKWEYKRKWLAPRYADDTQNDIELETLGKEGWELITVTNNNIAYFKRPLNK